MRRVDPGGEGFSAREKTVHAFGSGEPGELHRSRGEGLRSGFGDCHYLTSTLLLVITAASCVESSRNVDQNLMCSVQHALQKSACVVNKEIYVRYVLPHNTVRLSSDRNILRIHKSHRSAGIVPEIEQVAF